MGRRARGFTKGAAHVALQESHKKPTYDADLAQRLFAASPLANEDVRRAFAETYALIDMQLKDLRVRITDGTISNDEARTIPTLVQRLAQLASHLQLTKIKETAFGVEPTEDKPDEFDLDDSDDQAV